jgi:hypothetical protein
MTINPLSSNSGVAAPTTTNAPVSSSTGSPTPTNIPVDQPVISPLARLQSLLQQVHDNRTERFTQVTSQISSKLRTAAQQAQDNGHTQAADALNKLADDFQTASQTGQPPKLWELRHPVMALAHYHNTQGQADATQTDVTQTVLDAAQSAGLS